MTKLNMLYTQKTLMQALSHESVLKKVHRIDKLNQKAWSKPYIDMNLDLQKK